MPQQRAPYRADHVGSLLRPPELLEARARHAAGALSADELRAVEDRAILDAIALQREVGVDIYTDGEFRRSAWQSQMAEAVEGFATQHSLTEWHRPDGSVEVEESNARVVAGKLRPRRRLAGNEVSFLRQHAPGPIKMTLPSATVFRDASYRQGITDQYYPTRADLLADLVAILRDELRALLEEGVPYVQLDAPRLVYYADPHLREQMRATGVDPDAALDEAIAAENATVRDLPRDGATVALHLCRGNSLSRWHAEGGYDPIAEKIFGGINVDRFLLEYDSERAGGFAPLRFVPKGTTVVLGLVTTKSGSLERQDDLLRRIEEASQYVPVEHLALSPQCGFASVAAGNLLSPDEQRRKLELVVDTARKVWG